jgi:hypothetical protein
LSEGIDALLARVRDLEATLEIIRLEAEYARTWDTADCDGWAAVFSDHGVFEIVAVGGRPASRVSGRASLTDYCREFNATTRGIHLLHLPRISVAGDTARADLYFEYRYVRIQAPLETIAGITAGHYEVTYRRFLESWRMEHRIEKPIIRDNLALFAV